jgi:hypothetical protein
MKTTNNNTKGTRTTSETRAILSENMSLTAVDAIKEVFSFIFKGIAVLFGGTIGLTKASAKGIRTLKADDESMFGAMANKSIKSNYNMAQLYTYDMAVSATATKKVTVNEGDAIA